MNSTATNAVAAPCRVGSGAGASAAAVAAPGRTAFQSANPTPMSPKSALIFATVRTFWTNVPGFTPSTFVTVKRAIVMAATPSRPPTRRVSTKRSRYPANPIATAAIAPLAISASVIHPQRNAGNRPNASRM